MNDTTLALIMILIGMFLGALIGGIKGDGQTDRAIICMEAGNTADFCRAQAQILKD